MHRSATLVALFLFGRAISAQLPIATAPKPPDATKAAEPDPFGRDTPRGCVLGFLRAAERGDYVQAAQYLDTRVAPSQAQELARQLQAILNHGLAGNLDALSRTPEGDLKDGLRPGRDRAGTVQTDFGTFDILLDRVKRDSDPPIWLFSAETLRGVPRVYEEINAGGVDKFVQKFLPRSLQQIKFLSLPLWRWLAMILAVVLALILASLVTRGLIPLLRPVLRRMTGQEDDRYLQPLKHPIRLVLLALVIRIVGNFAITLLGRVFWTRVAIIVAIAGFTWLLIQFTDVVSDLRTRQLLRREATDKIAMLALVRRLFKLLVFFVAVLLLLHGLGVNVSAMLAGLGIGGIALALAAQKTLENLFGGITIISREAIRVGDFCQLADEIGTVEDIGLGSTRVRTLDRTVVSIPNAKVSQMNLENYSMRDKIWFHHVFGLPYDTSPQQVRAILTAITHMLREDRRVEKESARIRLIQFGPSSLNLEIFAYIKIRDYNAFLEIQEDLLLKIMDVITANGTSIALPSQIAYLDYGDQRRRDGSRPTAGTHQQGSYVQPGA